MWGIPITAYFLFVMFGQKEQFVYSGDYKAVIRQTSHIKHKTPVIGWVLLGCFLLGLTLLLTYVMMD